MLVVYVYTLLLVNLLNFLNEIIIYIRYANML